MSEQQYQEQKFNDRCERLQQRIRNAEAALIAATAVYDCYECTGSGDYEAMEVICTACKVARIALQDAEDDKRNYTYFVASYW